MAVISINDANFHNMITDKERCIVKFYADWCGTCRLLSADFNTLSALKENEGISFMEINAELNPVSIAFAGVYDLPFFIITQNGIVIKGEKLNRIDEVDRLLSTIK
jgi:thioredoxin 1